MRTSKQDRQGARTPADVERRFKDVPADVADAQRRSAKAEQEVENLKYKKITVDRLDIDGQELNIKVAATNITGKLTAEQIDAKGLTVEAANITGTLKAEQIEGVEISVNAADIQGQLTADQIDATNLKVNAANITGTLKAEQIDSTNLKVKAANITDTLTAKQIDATDIDLKKATIGDWHLDYVDIPTSASTTEKAYALYSDEIYDSVKKVTYQIYLSPKGVYSTGRDNAGDTQYLSKTWLDLLG